MITFKEYLLLEEMNKSLKDKLAERIKIPSEEFAYEIAKENVLKTFNVLNKEVFKSKLKEPLIIVENFNKSKHISSNGTIFIGSHILEVNGKDLIDFICSSSLDTSKIKTTYSIFLINGFKISFNDFIDILLHEMIHEYDYEYGDGKQGFIFNILIDKFKLKFQSYNEHGNFFRSMMEKINHEFGTNISITFDLMKNKDRNLKENIEKILENTKESDTFIISKKCQNKLIIDYAKAMRRAMVDDGTNVIEVTDEGNIRIIG